MISGRNLFSLIVLVSGGLIWFSLSSTALGKMSSGLGYYDNLLVLAIFAATTAIAALVGAFFPKGSASLRFLKIWMVAGSAASIIPLAINTGDFFGVAIVALLWGTTLGFGMPASTEYLAESTTVENRGRVGAIVFFATFVGVFISALVLQPLDYQRQLGTLGALRLVGLVVFILLGPAEIHGAKRASSYLTIVRKRSFFLYLSAWLMFSLVNYVSVPILNSQQWFDANFSATIEAIITAVFALVGGVLCDAVGRKVVVVSGFVMLGLGYAVLSVFQSSLAGWIYTAVDGIAWGMLGVVFFMILWGDLANEESSRKYYALGSLPLIFSNLLQGIVAPDLASSVSVTAVFSLASLFLFLAVLPLLYAPETLPEMKIRERELKEYLKKAKKIKEKQG